MAAHADHGLTELGSITKAHGLDGALILEAHDAPGVIEDLSRIFIRDRRGDLMPYQIQEIKSLDGKVTSFFVKLVFINDRTSAESFSGKKVFADIPETPAAEYPDSGEDDLTGWQVFDSDNNHIGLVEDFLEMPAHPVITISLLSATTYMVPLVDEYVVSVDEVNQRVTVKNLAQLDPEE